MLVLFRIWWMQYLTIWITLVSIRIIYLFHYIFMPQFELFKPDFQAHFLVMIWRDSPLASTWPRAWGGGRRRWRTTPAGSCSSRTRCCPGGWSACRGTLQQLYGERHFTGQCEVYIIPILEYCPAQTLLSTNKNWIINNSTKISREV